MGCRPIGRDRPISKAAALPRAGRSRLAARRRRAGILFSLPVVAVVGSLLLLPIGQTVYYSFTNWDGFSARWIGAANYSHLFHDSEFTRVLENNAVMVLAIP